MDPTFVVPILLLAYVVFVTAAPRIRPRAFPPLEGQPPPPHTALLPPGLPTPVERFYRDLYGDTVPVVATAVLSGRARIRIGLAMTARYRFTHEAGRAYEHRIEAGWFGLTFLRLRERYVNGRARLELPFGVVENKPKVDQAANLALWAESMWFPSLFLTDPRARWRDVDAETANLIVPSPAGDETFMVRFDPDTGLPVLMEAMRYKNPEDAKKTLWIATFRRWRPFGDFILPSVASLTWLDDGRPWAEFHMEEVVYNMDVSIPPEKGGTRRG